MKSRNGKSRVAVPSHYYKVFVRRKEEEGEFESIAFLLPHDNKKRGVAWPHLRPRAEATITQIKDIERKAGIRLHPRLDRAKLTESQTGEDWDFSLGKSNLEAGCK